MQSNHTEATEPEQLQYVTDKFNWKSIVYFWVVSRSGISCKKVRKGRKKKDKKLTNLLPNEIPPYTYWQPWGSNRATIWINFWSTTLDLSLSRQIYEVTSALKLMKGLCTVSSERKSIGLSLVFCSQELQQVFSVVDYRHIDVVIKAIIKCFLQLCLHTFITGMFM